MNSRKKGFSLVTVLFLIVGISITLGSVAFNFVTEGKLQRSDTNNNNSLSAAEIGLETGKMWLKDKLINSVIPTETKNINAEQGAPQYCLKGFNVSNIDVIDSKNEKLENIINKNTNFYKNTSFEYFTENITDQYTSKEVITNNNIFYFNAGGYTIGLNKFEGTNASNLPSIEISGRLLTGFKTNHIDKKAGIVIDDKNIYIKRYNNEKIIIFDKITGRFADKNLYPKTNISSDIYSGYDLPNIYSLKGVGGNSFFIDNDYVYYFAGEDLNNKRYIGVVNKFSGLMVPDVFKSFNINEKMFTGFEVPNLSGNDSIFIDNDYLYVLRGGSSFISIFDKYSGATADGNFPTINDNGATVSGFFLPVLEGSNSFFIDNNYLYFFIDANYDVKNGRYVGIVNKKTGNNVDFVGEKSFVKYIWHKQENFTFNISAFKLINSNHKSIFINGKYIFTGGNNSLIHIYDKLSGNPAGEPFSTVAYNNYDLSGYREQQFDQNRSNFFVDGLDEGSHFEYFKIRSCGYNKESSITRLEIIIRINMTDKSVGIKQLSWKQIF